MLATITTKYRIKETAQFTTGKPNYFNDTNTMSASVGKPLALNIAFVQVQMLVNWKSEVRLHRVFSVTGCPPALRTRHDCPWRLTILVPQELSFGVCLPIAPAVSFALGSQRIFCPLSLVLRAPACLMSRGDELRQLAAQLSVLAALEDSIALGLSRVMGPAGPGRAAAPPDAGSPSAPAVNAASAAPPWCLRPVTRWQLLCCTPRLSGLLPLGPALAPVLLRRCPNVHHVAVPASPLACVDRLLSRSRDWSRAWPPRVAHRSRLLSCAFPASLALSTLPQSARSHLSTPPGPLRPPPRPPRPLVPRSLRPTPTTNGTLSVMHTASHRLLGAPRPPSPSRPTPLVLVGVLATSVAAVSAKLPSAPCGGTFDLFPLLSCALSPGAASLFEGLLWERAHFRGSCGSVGRCGPFLRLLSSTWALPCVVDVGSGMAHRSATLKMRRSPTRAILISGNGSARQRSSWWSSSLAKGLHRRRIRCSWTSFLCSRVWRLQVVS